ncbi:hypothetical protein LCGC14_1751300 [marine sediment metagenome]|uniref:Uncharacterized protein n=1 Tax=marine sediment metagenome TaxID=412755 RepID=A0A0F9JIV7_9ZZZZ
MNEIKQKAERARGWRGFLDQCNPKHQWEWCLHAGLCETADWTKRNNKHNMFRWSE